MLYVHCCIMHVALLKFTGLDILWKTLINSVQRIPRVLFRSGVHLVRALEEYLSQCLATFQLTRWQSRVE